MKHWENSKHHCHCGFAKHLAHFKTKKVGFIGILLFGLHILWHVAECVVIPALLVVFGQKIPHEEVVAETRPSIVLEEKSQILHYLPLRGTYLSHDL